MMKLFYENSEQFSFIKHFRKKSHRRYLIMSKYVSHWKSFVLWENLKLFIFFRETFICSTYLCLYAKNLSNFLMLKGALSSLTFCGS